MSFHISLALTVLLLCSPFIEAVCVYALQMIVIKRHIYFLICCLVLRVPYIQKLAAKMHPTRKDIPPKFGSPEY